MKERSLQIPSVSSINLSNVPNVFGTSIYNIDSDSVLFLTSGISVLKQNADATGFVNYGGIAITSTDSTLGSEDSLVQFQAVRNGGTTNWMAYTSADNTLYLGFTGTTYNLPGFSTGILLATDIDQNIVAASSSNPYAINISGNAATATSAPPSGSAGGDLTGTYPNPTVETFKGGHQFNLQQMYNNQVSPFSGWIAVTSSAAPVMIQNDNVAASHNTFQIATTKNPAEGPVNWGLDFVGVDTGQSTFAKYARINVYNTDNTTSSETAKTTFQIVKSGTLIDWLDYAAATDVMILGRSASTINVPALTASQLVSTDSSKNLVSGNLSGDVSTSGLTATLATVNSNVGSFGSATQVPVFTVNGKGLITAVSNTTISGVAPGGAAGGDLTGTYPNPTIANLAVTNAKIANSTIDLTAKVTGILPNANGGTNQSTYAVGDILYSSATNVLSKLAGNITTAKQYLSQTGNGSVSAAPAWATITGSDITGAALTKTDDTNVTLTLGGTPTTALLRAASLTLGWTGTLSAARGGIGQDSSAWAQGDIPYISATGTWNHLAKNTSATRYLSNTGTTNNPAWAQIDLTNGVTGVLPNTNTTAATTNIASTIVARDGSGNFSAGTITATLSGAATSAANIVGGALGSIPYQTASSTTSLLAGNTTTTPQILTQVGNGSVSAAPTWTSTPTLTGLSITSTGSVFATITSTTTGSANEGGLNLVRGDQANGYAQAHFKTGASDKWAIGLRTGDDKFHIFDVTNSLDQYTITQGTSGNAVHNFLGAITTTANGSSTDPGSMAQFNSGSVTAGNIYGIGVQKSGVDLLYMGINKNTASGAVPASACYLLTYGSSSKLAIGRGASTMSSATADILLNGDGTLNFCNSLTPSGITSAVTLPGTVGDANYINFGGNGRNIGVYNGGAFFYTFNLDYDTTANSYKYNTSSTASVIEVTSGGGALKYAASGTAGNTVTPSTALSWDTSGNVNVPALTASTLVASDGSKNLSSSTTSLTPSFAGLTIASLAAYQCRAWVNFNGTGTIAIRASANVSSLTDTNVGRWVVNLTNAMTDANFSVGVSTQDNTNRVVCIDGGNTSASTLTTSTVPVACTGSGSSYTDNSVICVQIFR